MPPEDLTALRTTPAELRRILLRGVPGSAMPTFGYYTRTQLQSLQTFLVREIGELDPRAAISNRGDVPPIRRAHGMAAAATAHRKASKTAFPGLSGGAVPFAPPVPVISARLRPSGVRSTIFARCAKMPTSIIAGLWGLLAGSALLVGAALGCWVRLPQRLIAAIMAFGSGTLISALSFELMDDAYRRGGFDATSIGFLGGAAVYTAANWLLTRRGAQHRKRSGGQQPSESQSPGSGMAIAMGALLDGIPESVVIGTTMLTGGAVGWVAVVAIFLSNLPEGLSSSAGMKKAGRSMAYIFGVWCAIALASGISAWAGYAVFGRFSADVIAATTAVAAGAILAMLADTMIPEAFETAHNFAGLITVIGFLTAFVLSKFGG